MGARILVVDDSATMQKVIEITFSREDFVLVQARSGEEGIRKAMEARPDLVLLDIVMPDKDGYQVCAALRAQPALRNVPVILLTGTFEVFDQAKASRVGADDFVKKPFESQVLIGKVKKLLFTKSLVVGAPGKAPVSTAPAPAPKLSVAGAPEVPKPPPAAPRPSELPVPSLEISQDQLWQLLEGPLPPPAPPPSLDLSLDVLEPGQAVATPEVVLPGVPALDLEAVQAAPAAPGERVPETPPPLSLDLSLDVLEPGQAVATPEVVLPGVPALDLEAVQAAPGGPGEQVPEAQPISEETEPAHLGDLSLDDLLAGVEGLSAEGMTSTQAAEEAPIGETVFDLTPSLDAPPLPMVESGAGEAPSLSIEELLSSIESGAAVPTAAMLEGGATTEDLQSGLELAAADEPATAEAPFVEELADQIDLGVSGLDLEEMASEPPPAAVEEAAAPIPEEEEVAMAPALDLQSVIVETPAHPAPAVAPADLSLSGVVAAAAPPAEAASVPEAALAVLRDGVTERVARDLARELSNKLMERIEKVIWEVVPDLAEVLIAQEIERIRRMAEEQKSA